MISGLFWKGAPRQVLDLARSGIFTLFTIRPDKITPVIKADPDDDKVLACAKAAYAEVIVSGNSHLLDLKEYEGIKIMTVNQLAEPGTAIAQEMRQRRIFPHGVAGSFQRNF